MSQGFAKSTATIPNVAISGSNGSFAFTTVTFGNLNGASFYSSNGSMVMSYTVPAGGVGPNFSAGTTSSNLNSVVFSNSNGVSFGLNGSTITASHNGITSQTLQPAIGLNTAQTNVTWTVNSSGISLDAGAYLTNQSIQPAIGLNTAATNVTWTVNTSGISLNAGAYLTTAMDSNNGSLFVNTSAGLNLTNISATFNSNSISLSVNAQSAVAQNISLFGLGNTTQNSSTVLSVNALSFNAIGSLTVGYSNGSIQLSAPNALTTARASNDAVGLNTAQTNVTWTVNSSGISINASAYLTSQTVQPAVGLNTAATNVTWTVNTSGISLNAGAYLTTARASTDGVGLNTAQTNVTWTVNSAGISLNAGAYLTTARASNDGVGLVTAQTNVTWTVNSAGVSLNAAGYAGIGTSATNASITLNSNGLAISIAAPGGGVTPAMSGSNGSFSFSTVTFGALNGISFYTSNGSMVASYTVPAAGGAPAWELEGNNTAGTTSTGNQSTIFFSGGNNITLSGNSNTIIISAPSTIAMSRFPYQPTATIAASVASGSFGATGGSTQITATGYLYGLVIPNDIQFNDLMMEASMATAGGTGSVTIGHQLGIYTLEANTRMSLVSSFISHIFYSQNSSTAISYRMFWGANSNANSTAANGNISVSVSGFRWGFMNQAEKTLPAGNYYIGYLQSCSSVGSFVLNNTAAMVCYSSFHTMNIFGGAAGGTSYDYWRGWGGAFSTTTNMSSINLGMMPSTIHTSAITGSVNASQQRSPFFIMNRSITT